MKITIEINTDNAAFEGSAGRETARILRKIADRINSWQGEQEIDFPLMDLNGNKIGSFTTEG